MDGIWGTASTLQNNDQFQSNSTSHKPIKLLDIIILKLIIMSFAEHFILAFGIRTAPASWFVVSFKSVVRSDFLINLFILLFQYLMNKSQFFN